jgi:ADP-ribose pyrophosphatase YjhB (NUDIX family)
MNFCSECGAAVSLQSGLGEQASRYICEGCGRTHYQSPSVLVATYVCVGNRILWIRRATAPGIGSWALPGGYMERSETPESAASRELLEETGVTVPAAAMIPVSVSSILHMAQTHLVFRCHLAKQSATATTEEASECAWFAEDELPWDELAFPSIEPHVRELYRWLERGSFGIRIGFIDENRSEYRNFPLAEDRD